MISLDFSSQSILHWFKSHSMAACDFVIVFSIDVTVNDVAYMQIAMHLYLLWTLAGTITFPRKKQRLPKNDDENLVLFCGDGSFCLPLVQIQSWSCDYLSLCPLSSRLYELWLSCWRSSQVWFWFVDYCSFVQIPLVISPLSIFSQLCYLLSQKTSSTDKMNCE